MIERQEHVEPPHEKNSHKRRPTWERESIQDVEKYGALDGYIDKSRDLDHTLAMWPCYVTSLIKNLPTMKKQQRRKNGRIP